MPKLAFKRKSADETSSLSAYLPTQMVDYTSLPPIDDDTARTRFRRMPLVARLAAVLLPLLLLSAAGWGIWTYFAPAPAPVAAQAPPPPEILSVEARVVSGSAIAVEAQIVNLADGATGSAQLLENGEPVSWANADDSTGAVSAGKLTLRLNRAEGQAAPLDPAAEYVVAVTIGDAASALSGQAPLTVPEKLQAAFFAVAEAPAPTPEPTVEPTP